MARLRGSREACRASFFAMAQTLRAFMPPHHERSLVDGLLDAGFDGLRGLHPADVTKHHAAGQDDGTRIDLVMVSVFGRRSVRRFEDRMAPLRLLRKAPSRVRATEPLPRT